MVGHIDKILFKRAWCPHGKQYCKKVRQKKKNQKKSKQHEIVVGNQIPHQQRNGGKNLQLTGNIETLNRNLAKANQILLPNRMSP